MKRLLLGVLIVIGSVVSGCVGRTVGKVVGSRGGSTAASLRPDEISGLMRWGTPDTLSGSDGDLISSYPDQSGNSSTMTASLTLRPTLKKSIQNGLSVVRWNGTSNFMRCSALSSVFSGSDKPFTFFCVAKFTPDQTHQCFFIAADDVGGSNTPTHDFFFRNESWNLWADRRDNSSVIKRAAGWTPDSNWHTFILRFDGSVQTIFVDGIARGTIAADANVGTMTVGSYVIGAHNRNGATEAYFNGDWGDDGLYNVAISDSEVAGLHAWLQQKWNTATPVAEPWTPLQMPNLYTWFREDSCATTTDGATLAGWYTKAPYGTTEFSLTSGTKPSFKTNAINGRSAVNFNGTTHFLSSPTGGYTGLFGGTSQPHTVFGAFKSNSTSGDQTVFFAWDSASNNSVHRLRLNASAGGYRIDRRDTSATLVSATAGTNDTSTHTFIAIFDGSNQKLYIDGTKIIDQALTAPTLVIDTFTIGQVRANGGEFFSGFYGEVGTLFRAVNSSEIDQLNTYLQRWQ